MRLASTLCTLFKSFSGNFLELLGWLIGLQPLLKGVLRKGITPNARLPLLTGPIPDAENVHPRVVGIAAFDGQRDAKAPFPIDDKIPGLEILGLNFFR